jgi:hypothetical protein
VQHYYLEGLLEGLVQSYIKGELHSTERVSLDRAWDATQAAIKDMGFTVTTEDKDAFSATLVAFTADCKKSKLLLIEKLTM